jgi:hypothetical protein
LDVSRRIATLIDALQVPAKMLGIGPDWTWSGDCEKATISPRSGPEFTVRRGFPSSISCTLATLFGGECGACRGVVIVDELPEQEANYSYCPECKNSGHTEGIARDVFGRWPVTKTRLTCREPFNADNEEWQWFRVRNRVQTPAGIPEELFDAMEGCFPAINGRFIARFHSRESALTAISRAAVNLGRERAGLRPISWGGRMKYSAQAQALIDQWKARIGGLLTLRILGDVLAEDGDERMASACRDAVRWFSFSPSNFTDIARKPAGWFDSHFGPSRMNQSQWMNYFPKSPWHAIELYADFPELDEDGTGATELRGAA